MKEWGNEKFFGHHSFIPPLAPLVLAVHHSCLHEAKTAAEAATRSKVSLALFFPPIIAPSTSGGTIVKMLIKTPGFLLYAQEEARRCNYLPT